MRVLPVNSLGHIESKKVDNVEPRANLSYQNKVNELNLPYVSNVYSKNHQKISFLGKNVYIVDGGAHATNMQHFAKAISDDMDISMVEVETNYANKNTKQLRSLEKELYKLNKKSSYKGEYIAIPALASVGILNLQDQYERVMDSSIKLTPENLKANKEQLLRFLKTIYEYPNYYRDEIGYMDPSRQGIEYTYGVINEVNKLIEKGAKVYIPSGHPQDQSLKWMAGEEGRKPELYHFIATGEDKGGHIRRMHNQIKRDNWYDFNLLALSDANIVGVKGTEGAQDYMFAAYDSCVTDGARGVYNFSPVRGNKGIIGYSYTDTRTNQYPYDEFPANDEVANIAKFVGITLNLVSADADETKELKECKDEGRATYDCADKLYKVKDIFSADEIRQQKIDLMGDYVDKSLKLFFRINRAGEVIFPKCDCEGSGKPSVLSMWGSCFSVFNAIARDIALEKKANPAQRDSHKKEMNKMLFEAKNMKSTSQREQHLNYIAEIDLAYSMANSGYIRMFEPYVELGNLHYDRGHYDLASSCYNNAMNLMAQKIVQNPNFDSREISEYKAGYEKHLQAQKDLGKYRDAIRKYENMGFLEKMFSTKPQVPANKDDMDKYRSEFTIYQNQILPLAKMYEMMSKICSAKNESYPAKVCKAASVDIEACNFRAKKVIQMRAQGVQYIGDIYSEIK